MLRYRVKFFDAFGVLVKSLTLEHKPSWGKMIRMHTRAMKAYGGPLDYEISIIKEEDLAKELEEKTE